MTEELCGAVVYAGRLMDAVNLDGLSARFDEDGNSNGLHLPRCVLPKGHHPWIRPIGTCCRELFDSPIHSPGHLLDQCLFLPPEPPKCGANLYSYGLRVPAHVLDHKVSGRFIECILDRGHAGGHDSGLGEWR